MAVRPPKPPLPLRPRTEPYPAAVWAAEQHLWNYCVRLARLEVDSWFNGQPYEWVPYDQRARRWGGHPDPDLGPIDCFVLTK